MCFHMKKILFHFTLLIFLFQGISFASERVLTVAAASDLVFALKDISAGFEKAYGVKVIISFGSTGNLTRQIINGAPFDLFFAANESYIDRLKDKGLILNGTKRLYAMGRIVLAFNKRLGRSPNDLSDLLRSDIKRIAIANPAHAPYGIAAKQALISSDIWDKIQDKLVYGENIRQTLQFIETGDAPAGIVALSVADVEGIKYSMIPASLYRSINQAVAVIKRTGMPQDAKRFITFVNTPKGRAVMKRYGFILP